MAFRHFSCSNSRSEGALTLLSVHTPRIANEPEKKPLAFRERNALVQSIAERASFTFLYMLILLYSLLAEASVPWLLCLRLWERAASSHELI